MLTIQNVIHPNQSHHLHNLGKSVRAGGYQCGQQGFSQQMVRALTLLVTAFFVVLMTLAISGCASVNFDKSLANTNQQAVNFTQGALALARTQDQRAEMQRTASALLLPPLGQSNAVRLTLLNSPALQAMLAQHWANSAAAAQTGRINNPVFTFERLRFVNELELGRLLSLGLLDLLTLPQRHTMAQQKLAQQQLRLTSDVVDQVTQVRQAWVKAVAAQQSLVYAEQVHAAAQASGELAQRFEAAGNFSKLQRARQQAFHADATTQLATAQHAHVASKEQLIRRLGLTAAQAATLVLPERLPELPNNPRLPENVSQLASHERLDVQLAQAELAAQAKAQGLNLLTSFTDIELGVRRDTVFDNNNAAETSNATSNTKRGVEITLRLPVFDWGNNQRDAMNAQTLAAANRLEATTRAASSNLREAYSAYRTAFDVSKHYRDNVVPLRKTISEENLLRYNGMLIGVFELLADTREQVRSVIDAIAAEQQFWLADASLQASIMGRPPVTTGANDGIGSSNAGQAGDAPH
jgi:outer membrane protein TolC